LNDTKDEQYTRLAGNSQEDTYEVSFHRKWGVEGVEWIIWSMTGTTR